MLRQVFYISMGKVPFIAITSVASGQPNWVAICLTSPMKLSMSSFAGSKDKSYHSAYKASGVLPLTDHLVVRIFFILFAPSPSQAAGSGSSNVY